MQSATIQHLASQRSLNLTDYETQFDPEYAILWGFIKPQTGNVTLNLLEEVRKHDRMFERNGGREDACIVENNIDSPKAVVCLREQAADRDLVAHVGRH